VSQHTTLEDWNPKLPGRSWFTWLWLTLALVVAHGVFAIAGSRVPGLNQSGLNQSGLALSEIVKFPVGPIVVITMALLARKKYEVGRSSIYSMAVSVLLWWLGGVLEAPLLQLTVRYGLEEHTLLSIPFLLSSLTMVQAVWQLPQVARLRQEWTSIWYETLMLLTASLATLWRFALAEHILVDNLNWLEAGAELIGPVLSVGLLGFLLLAVMRQGDQVFVAYHWLLLGSSCFTLAFVIRLDGMTPLNRGWIDTFGLLGMVFWMASALTGTQARITQPAWISRFVSSSLTVLPYLAVLITYLITLTFVIAVDHEDEPTHHLRLLGLMLSVGVVTALIVVRQFLMILENRHLNETLELRVAERGQQLEVSQARLNASERLASLGQLTAGLAHEVNTPLASAMNSVMQAEGLALEYQQSIGAAGVTDEDHRQIAQELGSSLAIVKGTLNRLGELIRKMRAQGRNPNEGAVRFNPIRMAEDALVMLEHPAMQAKVELLLEHGAERENLFVHGDPVRFAQIVTNLTQNAIHACEDGRKFEGSRVRLHFSHDADHVILHVSDNGSGIPEKVLPRIFDPLFTTKADGRGTGLGLSIIKDIVTSHFSGQIDCETKSGRGTTFSVRLNRVLESTPVVIPPSELLEA
jgi:signal transduction histidine kinase